MKKARTLIELFSFEGFAAKKQLTGKFGDPKARIIELERKKKLQHVLSVVLSREVITIEKFAVLVTAMQKVIAFICDTKGDEYFARNVTGFIWKR